MIDADPQDIIDEWVEDYKIAIEKKVLGIVSALEKGEKPYYQFTMSFDEAVETIKKVHGKKAESLKFLMGTPK